MAAELLQVQQMGRVSVGHRMQPDIGRLLPRATSHRFISGWAEDCESRRRDMSRTGSRLSRNLLAAWRGLALGGLLLLAASAMASASPYCPGEPGVATAEAGEQVPYMGVFSPLAALPQWLLRGSSPTPAEYTIRHVVPEVRVDFSLLDKAGKPMPEVSPNDVEVFEDDRPVSQFLISVQPDQLPLTLEIMLDTSDSFRKMLPTERATVLRLLGVVHQPSRDQALLTAFDRETRTWTASDDQLATLFDWIEQRSGPRTGQGSGTILYDAIYNACKNHMGFSDGGESGRYLMVVVSDGQDTQSAHQFSDVIRMAQQTGTRVFTLTAYRGRTPLLGDRLLQRLAAETGGQAFVAACGGQLVEALAEIEREAGLHYRPSELFPHFQGAWLPLRAYQAPHFS